MRRVLVCCFLSSVLSAAAQTLPALGAEVRGFVKTDAPILALTHVRIIDGTGVAPNEDQTIVIRNGRFSAIGKLQPPADAQIIDLAGRTVLPGLVGMHDHLFFPAGSGWFHEMGFSFPRLYLACGVTTIRTAGSIEPDTDVTLKRLIDSGRMPGPKMHLTGPYLEDARDFIPQMNVIDTPAEAVVATDYWARRGFGSMKAYKNINRAELKSTIDAAHGHHLKVAGHLCAVGFNEAADLGIDSLEHGLVVDTEFYPEKRPDACPPYPGAERHLASNVEVSSAPVQRLIRHLVEKHTAITSTLPVFEEMVPNRAPLSRRVLDAMSPQAQLVYLRARAGVGASADSPWPTLLQKEMEFELAFARAGGLLIAGLDPTGIAGTVAGFGDQRELELLVEAGFSPVEAIKIATLNGATWLDEAEHIGSIAIGKQADLMVVRGNPAEKIADIENVEFVLKDGVVYDSAKLIESVRGLVGIR